MNFVKIALAFAIGIIIWVLPTPEGLTDQAWHLFAIFIATIIGIIIRPFPMPSTALIGLAAVVLTKTLTFHEAFSGFSRDVIWLIVFAFFVAHGIIKTGLGARISYFFMMLLGKKTLGLSYGLAATDLLLSPVIPSATARAGGILLPILESLANNYESYPHKPSAKKMASFLMSTAFQVNMITNAMFITAMAANPLIVDIAKENGIEVTWGSWALAASLPGILSLLLVPLIIYFVHPPEIKSTPFAYDFAKDHLKQMGRMKSPEWIMLGTFLLLIILWMWGPEFELKAASTALLGLCILLITRVLTWQELAKETGAWSTLIWFSVLLMMATYLNNLGFTSWFGQVVVHQVDFLDWKLAFLLLMLIYFYSHYFFASNIAHVGALLPTFLVVSIQLGAPPLLALYILGFFSSLFGGLTHYGSGPGAILYGAGYVQVRDWWTVGFIVSLANVIIWLTVGLLWWKFLG
nr:putative malate transporter YflS [Chlamydiota bacterium]